MNEIPFSNSTFVDLKYSRDSSGKSFFTEAIVAEDVILSLMEGLSKKTQEQSVTEENISDVEDLII